MDGFWFTVHGGVTLNAAVNLDSTGSSLTLEATEDAAASFGISCLYRATRLDVGVGLHQFGSGSFRGLNRARPIGGKARLTALLNWRYVEESWGAMYMGFSPGVAFVQHTDHLRSQVALILGRQPTQLTGIDDFNSGFSFGSSFGLLLRVRDTLSFYAEAQIVITTVEMQQGSESVDYISAQPLFHIGLAARL